MAKIIIAGNSCTIESKYTTEELMTLKKYKPECLTLKDENKKPVFMIDIGSAGSVSSAGIVFNGTTHDGKGLACLTQMMPAGVIDANSWIMDNIGMSILKLNELEAGIASCLDRVCADVAAVEDTISVVGGDVAAE